jgi:phospholipase D1/2
MSQPENKPKSEMHQRAPILEEGRNCWKLAPASRLSTLIDTADYFAAFAEACRRARRQILILGWDFDRRERLHRGEIESDLHDQLGAFLVELVRRKGALNIYLLSWDFNIVYAAERELLPALRLRLQAPPRLHFRLDGKHPKGASHHQKVVVIDDRVAFAGGIDLSRWRWDTSKHLAEDPRRTDPDGKPYPPFHDMMLMLEGDAAARLGDLARERWRRSRGRRIAPPAGVTGSAWPGHIDAPLLNVQVAIARTEPAYARRPEVREVERLYLDAIASAEQAIYIENQYFTSQRLSEALGARLAESDGPEVVMVLPEKTGGWLEQVTMDVLRSRVLKQLTEADRHHRLRIYYPHQPGLGGDCISVHAKLLIVDDRLLRIGSSNTSNRSMGLDSECDLAIESAERGDPVSHYITCLRNRLLAEHLDRAIDNVVEAVDRERSLIDAIELLRDNQRSLREPNWQIAPEINQMVPDETVIDPPEPFSPDYFVSEYVPRRGLSHGRNRLMMFAALVVALLALAAAWRWTPLASWVSPERISIYLHTFASPEARAAAAIGGFVIASLAMVPLTLLAVISGILFDGWQAFVYILAASLLAAAAGFFTGRSLGRGAVERFAGAGIDQVSKRLAKRGTVAVAVLRLLPIAPFTVFNLVAGSSSLGARQFLIGSLIGLSPGLAAITLFSASLWRALTEPSLGSITVVLVVGASLLVLAWLAKRWLRSS